MKNYTEFGKLYEKYKKSKCIFVKEDTTLDRNINQPNTGNPPFLPKEALVVTIDNLMSKDYDTFLSEYLKLVLEIRALNSHQKPSIIVNLFLIINFVT